MSGRSVRGCVGLAALVVMSATAAQAALIDVWDVTQGTVVTRHSPVAQHSDYPILYGGSFEIDIRDMFGGNFSTSDWHPNEIGNVRYRDGQGAGAAHWVEWMTPLPVLVESFQLHARGDGPEVNHRRDYSRFRLFGKDPTTSSFVLLYEYAPATHPQPEFLSAALLPLVAQEFRAEFTQYSADLFGGPRIFKLDGFGLVIPEPNSLLLFGAAAVGVWIARRR